MSYTNKPVNPTAFPTQDDDGYYHGMDLRDWFAGKALVGIMAGEGITQLEPIAQKHGISNTQILARISYEMADAMLAEREKS